MNTQSLFLVLILATLQLLFVGCDRQDAKSNATAVTTSSEVGSVSTDAWVGQWMGPEGTFLHLAGSNGKYQITIQNLDGPRRYEGTSANGVIQFERNGVIENIRASNGAQTGMKWLSDKKNCLTVRPGEGYCRG